MKMDVHHDRQGQLKVNPSWLFQFGLAVMIGTIGYFIDQSLSDIKGELEMSRIERAQIRADLTAFQIGSSGDRFSGSDWHREKLQIEKDLDSIRNRLATLEAQH